MLLIISYLLVAYVTCIVSSVRRRIVPQGIGWTVSTYTSAPIPALVNVEHANKKPRVGFRPEGVKKRDAKAMQALSVEGEYRSA